MLGALQPTPTIVTDYAVYPFVGLIDAPPGWAIAAAEVEAVIELPLRALAATPHTAHANAATASRSTDAYTVGATTSGAPRRASSATSRLARRPEATLLARLAAVAANFERRVSLGDRLTAAMLDPWLRAQRRDAPAPATCASDLAGSSTRNGIALKAALRADAAPPREGRLDASGRLVDDSPDGRVDRLGEEELEPRAVQRGERPPARRTRCREASRSVTFSSA